MSIFRSIVFTAVAAGLVVGLIVTAIQHFGVVPLILRGEVYEQAAEAAAPVATADSHSAEGHDAQGHEGQGQGGHDHGTEAWEPSPGLERNAFTAAANILTAIGFSLLLGAAFALRGKAVTWREGLLWGLAGFVVFMVAPGLGLPPELPGMPASELGPRQAWWIGTVVATAAGLGLVLLKRTPWAAVLGLVLIVAPHVVGAPAMLDEATNVPESLVHQFVVTVTLTSFLFWVLLGSLSGALYRRFSA